MNDFWARYGIFLFFLILVSLFYLWRSRVTAKHHRQELGRVEMEGYNRGTRIYRDGVRSKVDVPKWAPDNILQDFIDILDERAGKKHSREGSVVSCLAEILNKYDEIFGTYINGFRQGWDNGYTYGWKDSQSDDAMANFRRELADAAVKLEAVKEADKNLREDRLRILAELDRLKKRLKEVEGENN